MGNHWNKLECDYLLSRLKEAKKTGKGRRVLWHQSTQENLTPSQTFRYSVIEGLKQRFKHRFDPTSHHAWNTYRIATLDSKIKFFYQNALRPERMARNLAKISSSARRSPSNDSSVDNQDNEGLTKEATDEHEMEQIVGEVQEDNDEDTINNEGDQAAQATTRAIPGGELNKQQRALRALREKRLHKKFRLSGAPMIAKEPKNVFLGVFLPPRKRKATHLRSEISKAPSQPSHMTPRQRAHEGSLKVKKSKAHKNRWTTKSLYATERPPSQQPLAASGSGGY